MTQTTSSQNVSADRGRATFDPSFGTRGSSDGGGGAVRQHRRAANLSTVAVLIISLVVAGVLRSVAVDFQASHSPTARRTTGAGRSLAGMDSYALALLLGGLRGPLVMVLWANSEAQKADRDLQGIDTQIEWIRRLQPEFDSVHVFQMWNKAYNISVQMVGLSNKYTTILDAIDYGQDVLAERPDNLNIMKEMARIYGDKLATANPEKYYYRERIRRETRWRELKGAQRGEAGFQRNMHDPLLSADGRVLPQYLEPRRAGVDRSKGDAVYDGAELQYLKRYEPYRYGLSPFAIGYNYHKRAQMLMSTDDQKPIGLSEAVIDSQPALALRMWAESEWENSRKLECKAFGLPLPAERFDQEKPTAALAMDAPVRDAAALEELIDSYELSVKLAGDSIEEYERHLHLPEFITNRGKYASHIETVKSMQSLLAGDLNYLLAMQAAAGEQRNKLLATAVQHYRNCIREYGLLTIRYYTSDPLATAVMPPGVTRATVGTGAPGSLTAVTDDDVMRMMTGIAGLIRDNPQTYFDENFEDRAEYMAYVNRALVRIEQVKAAPAR